MSNTISVVQLPNTQGKDRYTTNHPVTCLRAFHKEDGFRDQVASYLADPRKFDLTNQQLYLAGNIEFLIKNLCDGNTFLHILITDQESDAALAGHLYSRARVMRHVLGRFTQWLLDDVAVDWEKESVSWFDEIMDPNLKAPEGYAKPLAYLREYVCISMTGDYAEENYPDRYVIADEYLDSIKNKEGGIRQAIDLSDFGETRIFPLEAYCVQDLESLYQWAVNLVDLANDFDLKKKSFPASALLYGGGTSWVHLSVAPKTKDEVLILTGHMSTGIKLFLVMVSDELREFANHIKALLMEYGSIEQTKIQKVADRVGAQELFIGKSA